jgi:hypothetical protein
MFQPRKILSRVLPDRLRPMLRRWEATLRSYAYQCPVCQRRVREFRTLQQALPALAQSWQTHGFDVQLFAQAETLNFQRYLCPYCRADDRSRLYALFLRGQAQAHKPGAKPRLLDIAPGRALRSMILKLDCFNYRTADLQRPDVDDHIDITNMPIYEKDSFDCFICSHVLEHVTNDRAAMAELFRILKPGGWGIAMVPIALGLSATIEDIALDDPAQRTARFGQGDHLRLYARQDFIHRLGEAGFTVDQLGMTHFGSDVFQKHGIAQSSVLYICRKN